MCQAESEKLLMRSIHELSTVEAGGSSKIGDSIIEFGFWANLVCRIYMSWLSICRFTADIIARNKI